MGKIGTTNQRAECVPMGPIVSINFVVIAEACTEPRRMALNDCKDKTEVKMWSTGRLQGVLQGFITDH